VAAGTGSDGGWCSTQKLALLVLDLEHAACKQKSEFDRSPQLHRTVKLMAQALRMDLQELHHDYRSVPSQLVGRLIGYESESAEVQSLLTKLRSWEGPMPGKETKH